MGHGRLLSAHFVAGVLIHRRCRRVFGVLHGRSRRRGMAGMFGMRGVLHRGRTSRGITGLTDVLWQRFACAVVAALPHQALDFGQADGRFVVVHRRGAVQVVGVHVVDAGMLEEPFLHPPAVSHA